MGQVSCEAEKDTKPVLFLLTIAERRGMAVLRTSIPLCESELLKGAVAIELQAIELLDVEPPIRNCLT